jgi:serine/threonine protein kinase
MLAQANIARFVHAQVGDKLSNSNITMELFMDVYEGNLSDVVAMSQQPSKHLQSVTKQILGALAFLATKNIIHRDIVLASSDHHHAGVMYKPVR